MEGKAMTKGKVRVKSVELNWVTLDSIHKANNKPLGPTWTSIHPISPGSSWPPCFCPASPGEFPINQVSFHISTLLPSLPSSSSSCPSRPHTIPILHFYCYLEGIFSLWPCCHVPKPHNSNCCHLHTLRYHSPRQGCFRTSLSSLGKTPLPLHQQPPPVSPNQCFALHNIQLYSNKTNLVLHRSSSSLVRSQELGIQLRVVSVPSKGPPRTGTASPLGPSPTKPIRCFVPIEAPATHQLQSWIKTHMNI